MQMSLGLAPKNGARDAIHCVNCGWGSLRANSCLSVSELQGRDIDGVVVGASPTAREMGFEYPLVGRERPAYRELPGEDVRASRPRLKGGRRGQGADVSWS